MKTAHAVLLTPSKSFGAPLVGSDAPLGLDALRPTSAKPFLKWVGGKRSILQDLIARLPRQYDDYYEPFVGGGALFFSVQPARAHLSDVNLHLVLAYRAVRDDVDGVLRALRAHETKHGKGYYLKCRRRLSLDANPVSIASLLIYLNKACFNGLYRVNRSGEFNVPMGDCNWLSLVDEPTLRADSVALHGVEIEQKDFSCIRPRRGAFYYLDPPYHETYDGYNGGGFGDDRHRELADWCRKIDAAGGRFMLSNSDTDLVRALYRRYQVERVSASRSVSCKAHQRGKENELLIRNYK